MKIPLAKKFQIKHLQENRWIFCKKNNLMVESTTFSKIENNKTFSSGVIKEYLKQVIKVRI